MQEIDQPAWHHPTGKIASSLPALHFVHGNSFPTGTYSVFLRQLQSHYQIRALEMHGHDPAFAVTDNWPQLCLELIASIEAAPVHPAILVGHSLGGMLSLMVARMRPDLVRCVVMLDSPVVDGWRAMVLHAAKLLRIDALVPPAKNSIKRRKSWANTEEAYQHFASKPAFAIWPEPVLRDYIRFGTEPYSKGVTLRFKRDIETAIYRTMPHVLRRFTRLPFPVPIGFICGTHSWECGKAGQVYTQKLVGGNFEWIAGGHLYPLESPELAAQKTHGMIEKLLRAAT